MLIVDILIDAIPCPHCGSFVKYHCSCKHELVTASEEERMADPETIQYILCKSCSSGFRSSFVHTKQGLIDAWNAQDPVLLDRIRKWRADLLHPLPEDIKQAVIAILPNVVKNRTTDIY